MIADPLQQIIARYQEQGICLALSGGCDSALLLAVLAGMRAQTPFPLLAVHIHTPLQTEAELIRCRTLAARFGVDLKIAEPDILFVPEVRNNAPDRCYHCKQKIFTAIQNLAEEAGCAVLFDGTNADDTQVHRPGRQALAGLGVVSPLADAGLNKQQIRQMAAAYGLAEADLPAAACLATRFPYGTSLTPSKLQLVETAEAFLRTFVTGHLRVRVHGELARIELEEGDFSAVIREKSRITEALKKMGFRQVTLDLAGFRSGSFDS